MGRQEMHAEFWWANLVLNIHVKDPEVGGRITLKLYLTETG
jgi:hypothetical protein